VVFISFLIDIAIPISIIVIIIIAITIPVQSIIGGVSVVLAVVSVASVVGFELLSVPALCYNLLVVVVCGVSSLFAVVLCIDIEWKSSTL
jgi:hypothetical protein